MVRKAFHRLRRKPYSYPTVIEAKAVPRGNSNLKDTFLGAVIGVATVSNGSSIRFSLRGVQDQRLSNVLSPGEHLGTILHSHTEISTTTGDDNNVFGLAVVPNKRAAATILRGRLGPAI